MFVSSVSTDTYYRIYYYYCQVMNSRIYQYSIQHEGEEYRGRKVKEGGSREQVMGV